MEDNKLVNEKEIEIFVSKTSPIFQKVGNNNDRKVNKESLQKILLNSKANLILVEEKLSKIFNLLDSKTTNTILLKTIVNLKRMSKL